MNWAERVTLSGAPGPGLRGSRSGAPAQPESDRTGAIVVGLDGSEDPADALALGRLFADGLEAPLVLARDGLSQAIERERTELVVVGPTSPSGLGWLRHRTAGERVITEAHLPVAIAPRGYARSKPTLRLITSGFDGSPESRQALEWAAHLTTSVAGRLRVITVHAPIPVSGLAFAPESTNVDVGLREEIQREQAAAIASLDRSVEASVRDGSPGAVLTEISRETDLLVMGSRGLNPLPAALLGSVTRHVVPRAACPVLIHPPRLAGVR